MEKLIDRIITIVFVIALIAIVYFVGKYVSTKVFGDGETNDMEIAVDDDDFFSDGEDLDDNYDSEDADYYTAETTAGKDVPEEYNDEIASIMEDVVTEEETAPKTTAVITDNKANKTKPTTTTTTDSDTPVDNSAKTIETRYMVVAGSFTSQANAEIQAKVLEKEGYSPEIVNFNNSKMFTLIAARYNSKASANAAAKQLKGNKIECYVHTKRLK